MSEPSPSTRFRGVALSIVAAGVALAPVILLAGSNLGFEPIAGAGQFTYNASEEDDTSPIP